MINRHEKGHLFAEQGTTYCIRHVSWADQPGQAAFQQLRKRTFIDRLHWQIPSTSDGREQDRYDLLDDPLIHVHCVYGLSSDHTQSEHLLAGVRCFELQSWNDSMVFHEFLDAGLLSPTVLEGLQQQYDSRELLEATRFCLQSRRFAESASNNSPFDLAIARDFLYTAMYGLAEQTNRWSILALVTSGYLAVLQEFHFAVQVLYAQQPGHPQGHALVVIDFQHTIFLMRRAGEHARARRLLALCRDVTWIEADTPFLSN